MLRSWIVSLVVCLFVVPPRASAQVNTERMRALDVEGVRSTLGADVALQSGNVDVFEIGGSARVDVHDAPHYAFLAAEGRYGVQSKEAFRDRTFGHLRYNYRFLRWLVGEAFTQLERNRFTLLQLRVLAGGGLRVQYLDTDPVKIFQGTTPMYEYENLDGSGVGDHPSTVSTVRWSNYLNLRFRLTDTTSFLATVYVQPRFDAFHDVRVLNQATLAVKITEHVSLTGEFELSYDSRPPGNVEALDLALRQGLRVSF